MRPSSAKAYSQPRSITQANKPEIAKDKKTKVTLEPKTRTLENSAAENAKLKIYERPKSAVGKSSRQNPELNQDQKPTKQTICQYQKQKRPKTQISQRNNTNDCALWSKNEKILQKMVADSIRLHDPYLCVCFNCTCGKHLCKVHTQSKPSMHSSSLYQREFGKKNPFDSLNFQAMKPYKDNVPAVDPLSTYHKDYPPKTSQTNEKILPVGCLKIGGPSSSLTSYSAGFPGYQSAAAEPFKPRGGQIVEGVKLNPQTTYSKEFGLKAPKLQTPIKPEDNLKFGSFLMCGSTYKDTYKQPRKAYSSAWKTKISKTEQPKYANQFNTTYNNNYVDLDLKICPAKIELETRQNFFKGSKLENLKRQRKEVEALARTVL